MRPGIIWPIHFGDWDGQSSNTGCGIGHMVMDGLIDVTFAQNKKEQKEKKKEKKEKNQKKEKNKRKEKKEKTKPMVAKRIKI